MTDPDQYYFGTLLKQFDVFAFPRTGSHLLAHCFAGLFDSVSLLPESQRRHPEAVTRKQELREEVLYALDLREAGVPYQPVWLNPMANGIHGIPRKGNHPVLLLIRDPRATAFSAWRARARLKLKLESAQDLDRHWDNYEVFYDAGWAMLDQAGSSGMLLRYEDLTRDSAALKRIADFVGTRPKLSPDFVHWITRFERFAKEGPRTFYREGNNDAWRNDEEWQRLMNSARLRDFGRFGYA